MIKLFEYCNTILDVVNIFGEHLFDKVKTTYNSKVVPFLIKKKLFEYNNTKIDRREYYKQYSELFLKDYFQLVEGNLYKTKTNYSFFLYEADISSKLIGTKDSQIKSFICYRNLPIIFLGTQIIDYNELNRSSIIYKFLSGDKIGYIEIPTNIRLSSFLLQLYCQFQELIEPYE